MKLSESVLQFSFFSFTKETRLRERNKLVMQHNYYEIFFYNSFSFGRVLLVFWLWKDRI